MENYSLETSGPDRPVWLGSSRASGSGNSRVKVSAVPSQLAITELASLASTY